MQTLSDSAGILHTRLQSPNLQVKSNDSYEEIKTKTKTFSSLTNHSNLLYICDS